MVLNANDFPLMSIGANVYARGQSSPIFTASNDYMASDLAFRLNRDQAERTYKVQYVERSEPVYMVFGR